MVTLYQTENKIRTKNTIQQSSICHCRNRPR